MWSMIDYAIDSRRVIYFFYEGGYRTVEPFCHGLNTATGEVLKGFQIGGYSRSGHRIGWKLFEVSGISDLTVTHKHFKGERPGYNPCELGMPTVFSHIDYPTKETSR